MSWLGAGLGFWIGHSIGGSLGGVIGAVIGSYVTRDKKEQASSKSSGRTSSNQGSYSGRASQNPEQELVFLGAAAAMLAKLAKADGHVTKEEIDSANNAFARLGIAGEKREYCIKVFRQAKDSSYSIYEYADSFADAQPSYEMRVVFYDILWDLACADGILTSGEKTILRTLPRHLRISQSLFFAQFSQRAASSDEQSQSRGKSNSHSRNTHSGQSRSRTRTIDPLEEAYAVLGCKPSDSDDVIKKAYREKAKKYHPDEMVAQGLPPELIEKANAEMARVNAAYDLIKKARR